MTSGPQALPGHNRTLSDFRPYGGEHEGVVPHLTVAHGNPSEADAAAAELQGRLDASGGIKADCASVVLIENSTGRWEEMHAFHLAPADT